MFADPTTCAAWYVAEMQSNPGPNHRYAGTTRIGLDSEGDPAITVFTSGALKSFDAIEISSPD